jgi:protein O-mannosyl-transferase
MSKPPRGTREKATSKGSLREPFLVGIILGITLLAYIGTLRFEFVYDDHGQIVQNTFVQSWHYVPQYFTGHVWKNLYPKDPGNYYRPFFLLWCLLNFTVFGLKPLGWHFTTVLLHLAATGLTYLVVWKLTSNRLTAAVTAFVFGVHPVHLEAVAWVSGATESLYSVAFLGAFTAYLNSRERKSAGWMALSFALYAAALLCKETAIVLPIVVLAHAWIYGARSGSVVSARSRGRRWSAVTVAVPYLIVTVTYLGLRLSVLKGFGHAKVNLPLSTVALTWPSLLCFYLKLLMFPVGLSEFYDLPFVNAFDVVHVLLPLLALLLVAIAIWYWQHRSDSQEVRFAAVWLLTPLLPLLNLSVLPLGDLAHDRYLYLPAFGFALLLAMALQKLPSRSPQLYGYPSTVVLATLVIAALLCLGTAYQSTYWANNFLLYTRAVRIAPHNSTAGNNLAIELANRGRYQEARALYERVLRERPDLWIAAHNFGYFLYQTGDLVGAEQYLLRAIQLDPSDPDEYLHLGLTRLKMGRVADAAANVQRAIELKPQARGYHFALGVILAQQGDCATASAQFLTELTIDPTSSAARRELEKCERRAATR